MGVFYHSFRLNPHQNWSSNTLYFHGAFLYFDILFNIVVILLELGWLLLHVFILSFLSVGLLFEHPTRHIPTLVVIVIVVACTGPGMSSSLVFSLPDWVRQIWRAHLTLPIITGYTVERTHITLQCPL